MPSNPSAIEADDWVDLHDALPECKEELKTEYPFYVATSEAVAAQLEKDSSSPIFKVDLAPAALWSAWIDNVDSSVKQRFSCTTCRRFIQAYGGLVQIDKDGLLQPLIWRSEISVPKNYLAPFAAMRRVVSTATVLDEFKITPKTRSAGARTSGNYSHFYLTFPDACIRKPELPGFASASVKDLATMLGRVLDDYSLETVRQTATILTEDKLPHADNHKAAIRWLLNIHENKKMEKDCDEGTTRHNLLYFYAATSYTGCLNQLRTGALSTLLVDVEAGKEFGEIEKAWRMVVDPMSYLRPKAAPTTNQIAVAESLMVTLGITENDMKRRQFALSELPENAIIWGCKRTSEPSGMFSKLKPRLPPKSSFAAERSSLILPATRISFTKLINDVLPKATKLEYKLDYNNGIFFFLTGFEGTKPLMQWHDDNNRVSWFVYHHPEPVSKHNLVSYNWNEIECIVPFPHLWDAVPQATTFPLPPADSTGFKYYHKNHGFRYLFCLKGVTLDEGLRSSLCLFPSLLKSEFHGVRRTIESYSNSNRIRKMPDIEEKGGIVAGIHINRSKTDHKHLLRVTDDKGSMNTYEIVLFE